jgi:hypothetical protein
MSEQTEAQFWFFGNKKTEAEYDAAVKQFNDELLRRGMEPVPDFKERDRVK